MSSPLLVSEVVHDGCEASRAWRSATLRSIADLHISISPAGTMSSGTDGARRTPPTDSGSETISAGKGAHCASGCESALGRSAGWPSSRCGLSARSFDSP
eukprot:6954653-Prymnesium_polylepis.1